MRAVTGRIISSRSISLARAAKTLSRFAESGTGAVGRSEVAAYLRRASAAFDELVAVHRELKASNSVGSLSLGEESRQEKRNKKRKIEDVGGDEGLGVGVGERKKGGVLGFEEWDEERKKKQRKVGGEEESNNFDEKSMEVMRGNDGEDELVGSNEKGIDRKRKKKKSENYGKDENGVTREEKSKKVAVNVERRDFDDVEKKMMNSVLVNGVGLKVDGEIGLNEGNKRKKNKFDLELGYEKIVVVRAEERPQEELKKKKEKKIKNKENSLDRKQQEDFPLEVGQSGHEDQNEQHKGKKKRKKEKTQN